MEIDKEDLKQAIVELQDEKRKKWAVYLFIAIVFVFIGIFLSKYILEYKQNEIVVPTKLIKENRGVRHKPIIRTGKPKTLTIRIEPTKNIYFSKYTSNVHNFFEDFMKKSINLDKNSIVSIHIPQYIDNRYIIEVYIAVQKAGFKKINLSSNPNNVNPYNLQEFSYGSKNKVINSSFGPKNKVIKSTNYIINTKKATKSKKYIISIDKNKIVYWNNVAYKLDKFLLIFKKKSKYFKKDSELYIFAEKEIKIEDLKSLPLSLKKFKKISFITPKSKIISSYEVRGHIHSYSYAMVYTQESYLEYRSRVDAVFFGWNYGNKFKGEDIHLVLTINKDGRFKYQIKNKIRNKRFKKDLIKYIKQIQMTGFGKHNNSFPYKIEIHRTIGR